MYEGGACTECVRTNPEMKRTFADAESAHVLVGYLCERGRGPSLHVC